MANAEFASKGFSGARIDEIAASLGSTSEWIRNEQQVFGAMDDLLTGAPPGPIGSRAKESQ